jgi:hypothetical protein
MAASAAWATTAAASSRETVGLEHPATTATEINREMGRTRG